MILVEERILNLRWMRGTDTTVLSEEERSIYHWGAFMSESRDQVEETEPVQEVAGRQLHLHLFFVAVPLF